VRARRGEEKREREEKTEEHKMAKKIH